MVTVLKNQILEFPTKGQGWMQEVTLEREKKNTKGKKQFKFLFFKGTVLVYNLCTSSSTLYFFI